MSQNIIVITDKLTGEQTRYYPYKNGYVYNVKDSGGQLQRDGFVNDIPAYHLNLVADTVSAALIEPKKPHPVLV